MRGANKIGVMWRGNGSEFERMKAMVCHENIREREENDDLAVEGKGVVSM